MPWKDGTGPLGQGPGRGRGFGRRGTGGIKPGAGIGGECVCPSCGTVLPHQRRIPCFQMSCPKCGAKMVRK